MSEETRERSFDELARGLASGELSRRKALRLMGAALVGGTLASLGIGEAAADPCKRAGKACKKNSQCCSGNCANGTCAACPADRVLLSNGTCAVFCTARAQCPGGCEVCWARSDDPEQLTGYCGRFPTDPLSSCTAHDDCPPGQFCGAATGIQGEFVCIPVC